MTPLVQLTVHASQFPDRVRRDLVESLRRRQVNHKFLYDSLKQTQKWLALHQAFSPSRTDADCAATYDRSFAAVTSCVASEQVHLVGLGCGGGRKDTRLLQLLVDAGKTVFYAPADVSMAMVLVARQTALATGCAGICCPLVCDLATADDLPEVSEQLAPSPAASRLLTCFGLLPNFEPATILPRLARLIRPGDGLLLSANLAPGPDYAAGVQRILPLYDNPLTRDWLMAFLLDLGVELSDGDLRFCVEDGPACDLKRVAAYFHFSQAREIQVEAERFDFPAGTALRLFFSYRHTPALVGSLLARHGLEVLGQWITRSEEEGVFLVRRPGTISF